MAEPALSLTSFELERPDLSHLITEDDTPVENWFQERQRRLLVESLTASWRLAGQGEPFVVGSDVGLFYKLKGPAVVPDVMVSVGVTLGEPWWEKHNRSYMTWEFGKAPDLVVEIVSNAEGGEEKKLETYAQAGVPYYVIFDPDGYLGKRPLWVYQLTGGTYVPLLDPQRLGNLGLGMVLWEGTFEDMTGTWLRWCDADGRLLLTGTERANEEKQRADEEKQRADEAQRQANEEKRRADQEAERARAALELVDEERRKRILLEEKLRALGIDPT